MRRRSSWGVAVAHGEVTLVPLPAQRALLDGRAHRATRLVSVRAARGETAFRREAQELGEVVLEAVGIDGPQAELAQARRVGDPAAEVETDQSRAHRGVTGL